MQGTKPKRGGSNETLSAAQQSQQKSLNSINQTTLQQTRDSNESLKACKFAAYKKQSNS